MHAFIVTVPYVLIEVTNFILANEIADADVYITRTFFDAEAVAERLKDTEVFAHVYIMDNVLLTYPITGKKCIEVVKNGKRVVKDLSGRKYDYAYYCNTGWLINSIFYTGFVKGNKYCKHSFLDHGYGTYLTEYSKKPLYLKLFINLMGYKCMDGSMLEALYMFDPDMLKVPHNGELRIMPYIDRNNKKLVNTLNHAFAFDPENNEFNDKDIIILEQGPLKVEFDKESFWTSILNRINHDEAIIKAHPRQNGSTLQQSGISISEMFSIPWEMIALNINIEEKTQMTIFSTSCVMPKINFDLEPTVIMLYKLVPVDYTNFMNKQMDDLLLEIQNKYSDKRKFFIPETIEEFEKYCREHQLV